MPQCLQKWCCATPVLNVYVVIASSPLKQAKILARHEQVQKAIHVTDAAITARRMNIGRRLDLKLNAATMAATFVRCHASTLCQTAMWLFAGIE